MFVANLRGKGERKVGSENSMQPESWFKRKDDW